MGYSTTIRPRPPMAWLKLSATKEEMTTEAHKEDGYTRNFKRPEGMATIPLPIVDPLKNMKRGR